MTGGVQLEGHLEGFPSTSQTFGQLSEVEVTPTQESIVQTEFAIENLAGAGDTTFCQ